MTEPTDARSGFWGFPEAIVGWLVSQFAGVFALVAALTIGGWSPFAPTRPGGHIGRVVGQLASGTEPIDDTIPIVWTVFAFLPQWIGLLGGCWVFGMALGRRGPGWNLRFMPVDLWQGMVVGLAMQILAIPALYTLIQLILGELEPSARALTLTDRVDSPLEIVLLVLAVAVGAPVVEELFYRGVVQRNLVERLGPVVGIGVSSLIFGAVHLSWFELPALTLAGLGFGILAWSSGRLGPAIIAHMAFNGLTLAVLLS